MKKILAIFSSLFIFFILSCANEMEEKFGTENDFALEGEAPTRESSYTVYQVTTTLSDYNSKISKSLSTGKYHTNFELSDSTASSIHSYFSFSRQSMTKSQITSFLSGVESEDIDSFISAKYAFLALAESSSEVRILLKMQDSASLSLNASSNSYDEIKLTWTNMGYTEYYVYIWVDGSYKTSALTSMGSASLSDIAAGNHTIVLKDGDTSSASDISNETSVTVKEYQTSMPITLSADTEEASSGKVTLLWSFNDISYSYDTFYIFVDNNYYTSIYDSTSLSHTLDNLSEGKHTIVLKSTAYTILSNEITVSTEKTYILYEYTTTKAYYESVTGTSTSTGRYYYPSSTMTEAQAETFMSKFNFSQVKMTRSEVESFLENVPSSAIDTFLSSDYYRITNVISTSSVKILLKKIIFNDEAYTPKTSAPSTAEMSYSYITSSSQKRYTVSVKGGNIYCITFANSYVNTDYLSSYGTKADDAYISAENSSGNSVLYTSLSGSSTTDKTSYYGTLYLKPESDDIYTITISPYSNSSSYSGWIGFHLYTYFEESSSNYTVKDSAPTLSSDFSYAYLDSSNSSKIYSAYLTSGNIYCVTVTNERYNPDYIEYKFGDDSSNIIYKSDLSVSDSYGNTVKTYDKPMEGNVISSTSSYESFYIIPPSSGYYTFTQSQYNSYYSGFAGFHLYTYFDASTQPYSLTASFNPYTSKVSFGISSTSQVSTAYIAYTYAKSSTTNTSSYGENIASSSSYTGDLTPDSSYETSYTFYIVDSSGDKISNLVFLVIPKTASLYKLYDTTNSADTYPNLSLTATNQYNQASSIYADIYRKEFEFNYSISNTGYSLFASETEMPYQDNSTELGKFYAYYAANSSGTRISNYTLGCIPSDIYTAPSLTSIPNLISQFQTGYADSDSYTIYKTSLTSGTYKLKVADKNINSSLLSTYSDPVSAHICIYKYDGTKKIYYYNGYYNSSSSSTLPSMTVEESEDYYIVCKAYTSGTSGHFAFSLYKSNE